MALGKPRRSSARLSRETSLHRSERPDLRKSSRLNPSLASSTIVREYAPTRRRTPISPRRQPPRLTIDSPEGHRTTTHTPVKTKSQQPLKISIPASTYARLDMRTLGGKLTKEQASTAETEPKPTDQQAFLESEPIKQQFVEQRRRASSSGQLIPITMPTRPLEIRRIFFGLDVSLTPWYSAPYPEEYYDERGELWICEFCLKYMRRLSTAVRHLRKCAGRAPPGDEIYRRDGISIFEVNGRTAKIYCQNLCLLAKMFLDHKTLYYDVDPFMFYVLVEWRDPIDVGRNYCSRHRYNFVGYFSKEKASPVDYNLSCILTLPHHQRKGYGSLLIDFSYLLTRREGRLGTPEKPLSDLGLFAYVRYWTFTVMRELLKFVDTRKPLSIQAMTLSTGMTTNDILSTLEHLQLLHLLPNNKFHIYLDKAVLETWRGRIREEQGRGRVYEDALIWSPYNCIR